MVEIMNDQRVPILVYHHVYPDDAPEMAKASFKTGAGVIGAAEFRRQMKYLADNGWKVVSTSQLVDWLLGKGHLPNKAALVHFDNGWLDTATVAPLILRDFGFTATCFPITDGLEAATRGISAAVRTLTEGVVEKPFMTWDQAKGLLDAGWELGAHTATHCKIADRHAAEGDAGVVREAEIANGIFQKRLGFTPPHFAYPSGSRNDRTDQIMSGHYRSLRLWHFEYPCQWTFTDRTTPVTAIDCQNIDIRVSWPDYVRIFEEALSPITGR